MTIIPNTPLWNEFFIRLRELPELWKVKSDMFKDRIKKRNAWQNLLVIYLQIDPAANLDSLKKRLGNIKTCYRRELKKVQASIRSGAGAEDEYIPNLWYFESLDFLRDHTLQITGLSTIDLEEEGRSDSEQVETTGDPLLPAETAKASCPPLKRKKTVAQQMAERNDLLKEALGHSSKKEPKNKDETSVYAESWATSFRKLSYTQQIYAKKAIEEILVLGQLNLLTLNSIKSPEENYCHPPSHTQSKISVPSKSSMPFF